MFDLINLVIRSINTRSLVLLDKNLFNPLLKSDSFSSMEIWDFKVFEKELSGIDVETSRVIDNALLSGSKHMYLQGVTEE